MSPPKLRILCLHGYRQSGDVFREKTGGLRKTLSKAAEFHFITAPHVANVDNVGTTADIKNDEDSSSVERLPRGWWFTRPNNQFSSRDVSDLCDGFDETIALVHQSFQEQGPFDGILGFSQGACLTALICALRERGGFNHDFRFALLFAGFQSGSSKHRHLVEPRLITPSMHVVGKSDAIISETMSQCLIGQFQNAVVVEHPQGHLVPSSKAVAREVLAFLESFRVTANNADTG